MRVISCAVLAGLLMGPSAGVAQVHDICLDFYVHADVWSPPSSEDIDELCRVATEDMQTDNGQCPTCNDMDTPCCVRLYRNTLTQDWEFVLCDWDETPSVCETAAENEEVLVCARVSGLFGHAVLYIEDLYGNVVGETWTGEGPSVIEASAGPETLGHEIGHQATLEDYDHEGWIMHEYGDGMYARTRLQDDECDLLNDF